MAYFLYEKNINLLPKKFYSALHKLKNNNDITITRSDKGQNIVILHTADYIEKCNNLLSDNTTYTKLRNNPLNNSFNTFNKKLKSLCKDFPNLHTSLKAQMSNLSQFYGIPKLHKPNITSPYV